MATTGSGNGYGDVSWLRAEGREPGARRKKIGGYLKAANELRQSYFNQEGSRLGSRDLSDDSGVEGPGAFPDAAIFRGDHEEMILFPSYARRHVKRKTAPAPAMAGEMSEQEYWRREFNRHQDDKAVVDVDVRGWIYVPHRGPLTRKHRLGLGVVRQLAGLPQAPTSSLADPASIGQASSRAESAAPTWKQDQESIAFEAERIAKKGEKEKQYARRGAFSEETQHRDADADSIHSFASGTSSREPSPHRDAHRLSAASVASVSSTEGDPETPRPVQRQSSFRDPAHMSSTELATANTHLFNRFKAFLANPVVNATVSAFFYNETSSRQHTVTTNASGHFTCRAPLDFVPTHVRVLAGEKISATEEVTITSPSGVSLISDIDDTIKHSGVSVNAREIFRNTFIRELGDLTIDGVREWYNTLHDMGVRMHYVSNSPWQLYPVLTTYFKMAHLPKGSFHLKQYSGMLQGIFEPVAERKKSSLEKIMYDFPDRKFVLIGDSGEADLEVYTDVAIENPGRILGIFIRDVTTPVKTGYFDPSNGASGGGKYNRSDPQRTSAGSLTMSRRHARPYSLDTDDDPELKAAIAASLASAEEQNLIDFDEPTKDERSTQRPSLPPRHSTQQRVTESPEGSKPSDDLIDFSDEPTPKERWLAPPEWQYVPENKTNGSVQSKSSPAPPPKPQKLRSPSPSGRATTTTGVTPSKPPPPPRPRKPSTSVHVQSSNPKQSVPAPAVKASTTTLHHPSPLSQVTLRSPELKPRPTLPARPKNISAITSDVVPRQNSFPPSPLWQPDFSLGQPRSSTPKPQPPPSRAMSSFSTRSMDNMRPSSSGTVQAPPPPPLRVRNATWNTPAVSNRKTTNRISGAWSDAGDEGLPGTPGEAGVGRKEFLWNQRWARAKRILDSNGITLRSWRVGSDVADVCIRLVEGAMHQMEKDGKEPR